MTANHLRPRATSDGKALLNLGCGARFHPEWNNLDFVARGPSVIAHDILTGLPYDDQSFDAVYSAHFLEHLSGEHARAILAESFRLLKSSGTIRVVVPDLEFNVRLYLDCLQAVRTRRTPEAEEHYEWAYLNLINQLVRERPGGRLTAFLQRPHLDPTFIRSSIAGPDYDSLQQTQQAAPAPARSDGVAPLGRAKALVKQGLEPLLKTRIARTYQAGRFQSSGELHKWMYDSFNLTVTLEASGYVDVRSMSAQQSGIDGFARYCLDVDSSGAVSKPNSLFLEARRP